MLLGTAAIWGVNSSVVKLLIAHFPAPGIAVVRVALALSVFVVVVGAREGRPPVSRRSLPFLALSGLLGVWLNQVGFIYGLENTSAASMTMILATIPIFVGLGAFLLGWERPGWRHWTGVAVALGGVALIVLASPHEPGQGNALLGDLLGLLAAAGWAAYSLMLRPLMRSYSPYGISLYVLLVGVILLAPLGLPALTTVHMTAISLGDVLRMLYTGVIALAFTNILWFVGVDRLGPSRATVYSYPQPFFGVIAAVIILHESLAVLQVIGGVAILFGVIFGDEPRPVAPSPD